MKLIDYITDLLIDFDEMGFSPTTTCPNPDAYAIEWRNKITKALKELTEENERLNKEVDRLSQVVLYHDGVAEMEAEEAKADTVRKMQEELKKTFSALCKGEMSDLYRIIDQIAKGMIEGETK